MSDQHEPAAVPYYHRTEADRGVIVVAADPEAFGDIDRYAEGLSGIGLSVVVLVGDHDQLRPLAAGQSPDGTGRLSAPAVYDWVRTHLSDATDVLFIP